MTIESNISEVIAGLEAYRDEIEPAIRRAIAPERWMEQLRWEAEKTLTIEAGHDALWAVPQFLRLMGAAFLGDHSEFWMSAPEHNTSEALAGAVDAAERVSPGNAGGRGVINAEQVDLLDRVTVQQAMQLIKEWIEEGGKELTDKDQELRQQQGRFDNLLVERIWHIFGIHPADLGHFNVSGDQEEAIDALTPHIVEFFSSRSPQGLSAETVDVWLKRVLAVWTEHIKNGLPGAIEEEFGKLTIDN